MSILALAFPSQVVSVLLSYRVELRAAFAMFDLDCSGKINLSEFKAGLMALSQHLDFKLDVHQIEVRFWECLCVISSTSNSGVLLLFRCLEFILK